MARDSLMRSQNETRDRLRAAAMELLLTEHPDAVTVRAIADHAASHHPFVATLFGGKIGLFRDIYPRVVAEAVSGLELPLGDRPLRPETVRMARLASWLATNGDNFDLFESQVLVGVVAANFSGRFGLDPDRARLLAELVVASTLSWLLFPALVSDGRANLLTEHAAFIDAIARSMASATSDDG